MGEPKEREYSMSLTGKWPNYKLLTSQDKVTPGPLEADVATPSSDVRNGVISGAKVVVSLPKTVPVVRIMFRALVSLLETIYS